jgi:diguanylate cyclase (GGDEF)-like protein
LDRHGAADELRNAYRDDLTGTLVRAAGRDQLMQAVARAHRTGEALIVAFVDVDHLKQVNDEHGHVAGDNLLRAVGAALRQGLRSYDVVVRYGGDEFVCGLPDVGLTEAERRFNDVANLLSTQYPQASLSIGLAELQSGETGAEVIDRADQEMYHRRRNRHQSQPDTTE